MFLAFTNLLVCSNVLIQCTCKHNTMLLLSPNNGSWTRHKKINKSPFSGQTPRHHNISTHEDINFFWWSKELTLNCPSHSYPTFSPLHLSLCLCLLSPSTQGTSGQRLGGKNPPEAAESIYKTLFQQLAWQAPGPPGARRWVKNEDRVTAS